VEGLTNAVLNDTEGKTSSETFTNLDEDISWKDVVGKGGYIEV